MEGGEWWGGGGGAVLEKKKKTNTVWFRLCLTGEERAGSSNSGGAVVWLSCSGDLECCIELHN